MQRSTAAPRRRLSGTTKVWLLSGAIAVAAVFLYAAGVRRLPTLAAGDWPPLPLLVGLFYLAQLIGSALALTLHRRQPVLKLAFNLSQFALQGALAVVVFRYVVALGDPLGPAGWVAALLATQVTLWVADAAINAAIHLSGDRLPPQAMWEVLGLGVIATAMNTSLALIAVTILARSPASAWLALTPLVVLFVAYRAYSSKRAQHERLEALYEATRALHESPQLESAMVTAASQARKLLDAQGGEIILLPDAEREAAFSTRLGPGDRIEVMRPIEFDANEELWRPVVAGRQTILVNRHADHHGYLAERGIYQAVVAPLQGGDRVAGILVVADRLGDVSTFGQDDVKLLETLANHVSVALENGRLGDSLSQLTRLKEELRHQAFHDHLTGLPNRTLFTERVAYALERQDRAKQSLAVLFVDLDDFKTINDSLGHPAGDPGLGTVAERLRRGIPPRDTRAPPGGDEFGILLDDMSGPSDALIAAERIIQALNAPAYLDGQEVSIRASEQHEFTLEYQPIVNLETRSIEGVEALVRWRHPTRGVLSPSEFIPLAEDTGLSVPLGLEVLREACVRAAGWQVPGHSPLAVSVNLSPKQLTDPNLVTEVDLALRASGLEPSCLILEMTEDVLMHETEAILHTLREVIGLGEALGLRTVAEGIETAEQLHRLRGLRCEQGQGFLFARPLDDQAIDVLLREGDLAVAAAAGSAER